MKLNLRKAAALVAEIRSAAKDIDTKPTFSANLFSDNIRYQANDQRKALLGNIKRKNTLENAAFVIRASIGRANAGCGINDLLAEDAYLESIESRLRVFSTAKPQESWTDFNNAVEARRSALSSGSVRTGFFNGFESSTEVNILEESDIQDFAAELRDIRKHRRQIKDMTVELNIRTEIEVPADIESLLKSEGLI